MITTDIKNKIERTCAIIFGGIVIMALLTLVAAAARCQTFIAGGIETGGNNVRFKDTASVEVGDEQYQVFMKGARIDKYNFFGGWVEGQYKLAEFGRAKFNARALTEVTTDPKNLGGMIGRDGYRYHVRPELEASIKAYGKWNALVNSGVGYTYIYNKEYSKGGLNPHLGAGVEYDGKYRFTAARLFKDTTSLNGNETEGYRFRGDALYPFSAKWGAKLGLEYTRYSNIIPGLEDEYSPYPCHCVRTKGSALVFRVGVARLFGGSK